MNISSPTSNQADQGCPIEKLNDAEISEIFKRLPPPYERLLFSEVCRRWYRITQTHRPWRDVTCLRLNPIPNAHIRTIIKQCPNLQSIFANGKSFETGALSQLHLATNLSCVKFYDCTFAMHYEGPPNLSYRSRLSFCDYIPKIFSENIQQSSWNELVLQDIELVPQPPRHLCLRFNVQYLPSSLKCLLLTVNITDTSNLVRLQDLECFILMPRRDPVFEPGSISDSVFTRTRNMAALKNLRELCMDIINPAGFKLLVSSLLQLKALFAGGIFIYEGENTVDQFTDVVSSPALRILILAGRVQMRMCSRPLMKIPGRKSFPNGFGYDPLSLLNIFVSNDVSRKIRFTPSDATIVHLINAPLPEFLERADIAPIFEGVWIAEKIKEAAKYGERQWWA